MVETADLAFTMSIQTPTVYIQVMESDMCRGEDHGEYQQQSNEPALFGALVECFAQHMAMIA